MSGVEIDSAGVDKAALGEGAKMSLWEHLAELRSRLVRATLAIVIGMVAAWNFHAEILGWLLAPYKRAWHMRFGANSEPDLQTLSLAGAFTGYLQLSLVAGLVCAIPVIFYQLWAFVSPGLYAKEKRFIVPFVFFSTVLFLGGVAFAYYVGFPFTYGYLLSLVGPVGESGVTLSQKTTLAEYIDFSTHMLIAMGFVFEMPIFITFLALAGIVTTRQLVKFSRWAILIAFIAAAFITPGGDVVSQFVVAAALLALYFFSIIGSLLVARKRPEKETDAR